MRNISFYDLETVKEWFKMAGVYEVVTKYSNIEEGTVKRYAETYVK